MHETCLINFYVEYLSKDHVLILDEGQPVLSEQDLIWPYSNLIPATDEDLRKQCLSITKMQKPYKFNNDVLWFHQVCCNGYDGESYLGGDSSTFIESECYRIGEKEVFEKHLSELSRLIRSIFDVSSDYSSILVPTIWECEGHDEQNSIKLLGIVDISKVKSCIKD